LAETSSIAGDDEFLTVQDSYSEGVGKTID